MDDELKNPNLLDKALPPELFSLAQWFHTMFYTTTDIHRKAALVHFYNVMFESPEAFKFYKKAKNIKSPIGGRGSSLPLLVSGMHSAFEKANLPIKLSRSEEIKNAEGYIKALKTALSCINQSAVINEVSNYEFVSWFPSGQLKEDLTSARNPLTRLLDGLIQQAEHLNKSNPRLGGLTAFEYRIPRKNNFKSKVDSQRKTFLHQLDSNFVHVFKDECKLPSRELYDLCIALFPVDDELDDMNYNAFRTFRSEKKKKYKKPVSTVKK